MQENKQENPPVAELEESLGAGTTPAESTTETIPAADAMPSQEDLLKTAELKAAEHHDAWLRAKAEGENIRRRAQEDIVKAGKFAIEKFAGELLAVKDSLEAALANEQQDAAALRAGVELTLKQLVSAFEKSNLAEIHPLEEKFDPHRHQAISQIEADGEPNRVINVLQKGYVLNERVIRPALVVVSKARAAPAA
ncbi:nucleotide exchange factor GrpE [Sulfurisoma sediminicola]|uniref:Protein GrpE n=1 Tax=Sulfurisoma sediminicola TaxID=1381557 RepID=A0A497XB58_9PROT|nr:nucleotide exchange factor GrpE [Sulfurisoma sediminicola]RLJ63550.1 molecular chaperone GrpE [Sulfurisoma sediminicola]